MCRCFSPSPISSNTGDPPSTCLVDSTLFHICTYIHIPTFLLFRLSSSRRMSGVHRFLKWGQHASDKCVFSQQGRIPCTNGRTYKNLDSVCNLVAASCFKERQRGFNMVWSDSESPHQLAYEASWRTIMPEKGSFAAVPTEASHSFKSSLKHTYTVDTRDDNRMPTEGLLFRCTNELAGLGGDVKFLKQQIDMQAHIATTIGATLSVSDSDDDDGGGLHVHVHICAVLALQNVC